MWDCPSESVVQLDADHHASAAHVIDHVRVAGAHVLQRLDHVLPARGAAVMRSVGIEQFPAPSTRCRS